MSPLRSGGAGADPHIVAPGTAATPFTAEQIRHGCPAGRTVTTRVREGEGPARFQTTRFVSTDERGALIEMTMLDADSEGSAPRAFSATWEELQAHAAFDVSRTSVSEETLVCDLGVFDCLRYTVSGDEGVADYWFARDLPGMPIKVRAPDLEMDVVENAS